MGYRTRTRDLRVNHTGTLYYNGTLLTRTMPMGQKDTCYDWVDRKDQDNSLDLTHDIRYLCKLNGTKYQLDGKTVKYQFTNYPCSWAPGPFSTLTKYPAPNSAQQEELALKIAALSNPSVPHVSVPTFVGELRDIPGMVKGWGEQLFRRWSGRPRVFAEMLANGLLTWKWGIKPLISDLQKMFNFSDAVLQRVKWLQRLQEDKCLRRRVMLEHDDSVVEGTTNVNVQSLGGSVTAYRDVHYTKDVWGTARWNLDPNVVLPRVPKTNWVHTGPGGTEAELTAFDLAERLTYGFTLYEVLPTLWELTPWSWLIDWFSGVGQWIAANNNTLPLSISHICLMRHLMSQTRYRVRPPPYSDDWIAVDGKLWTEVEDRKERYVCAKPTILALVPTLPCLTTGQLSILGSLQVLKTTGALPARKIGYRPGRW